MKTQNRTLQWFVFLLLIVVSSMSVKAQVGALTQTGNQTVCIGSQPYGVMPTAGSTYAWTITGGSASDYTLTPNVNLATVNWTVAGNYTLQVLETNASGCTTGAVTIQVIVNPIPDVADPADQVVCNSAPTTAINFTGSVPGSVYTWVNDNAAIGLAANGTGNIASFTATNATNAPITANITVTPSFTNAGTTCTGTPQTFTIIVNPTPTVNDPTDQVICNNAPTTAVNFSGNIAAGVVYTWTNDNAAIGLAANGTGNIASFTATNATNAVITANITVTPSFANGGTTCPGTPQTFVISVNPTPTVADPADQVVCNNAPTTAINFTGNIAAGVVYTWTNDNAAIGLAANGTGDIASFTATNATNALITANITVTPSFANGGTTCPGTPQTFIITVNPAPTVNDPANQVVCNNAPTTAVNFTGNIAAGVVYTWTNDNAAIGLAANGTGDIASFTATNATNAVITANITVTPSFASGGTTCPGVPQTFIITVNPTPTVNDPTDQVICNNAPTTAVNFTGNIAAGVVYTWTNDNAAIGLTANGTGDIASFTATNATNAAITANITVTPSFANGGSTCPGTPQTFIITVNPTPTVNDPTDQVVCNNAPTTAVNFTGNIAAGVVYTWTNDNAAIGLAANGTGNIASFTAINATNAAITANITVTPSFANGGSTCPGTPQTFIITVNPTPTVNDPTDQVVCTNAPTTAVNFTGNIAAGVVYTWTNDNAAIGLAANGTGDIASFTATNATNAAITANITVTPSFANGGTTCPGTPQTFIITVNPTPTVNDPTDQVVCNNAPTTAVNFTGNIAAGVVYTWTNDNAAIGLAANGTGNIASFTAINATNAAITANITVTPSFANGGTTCPGTPQTFIITVNPTPTVNDPTDLTVCNNSATTAINFAGNIAAGVVYTWTNDNASIGLAANGTGNIASFTAINPTAAPIVATITVTPSFANGGTTCPGTPQTFTITVNPQPVPTLTGPSPVCITTTGHVYTTEAGMTSYVWTIVGGTITSGGTATNNTATITWNTAGTQSVSINYTNGTSCTANVPTPLNVTVNPLPATSPIYHN